MTTIPTPAKLLKRIFVYFATRLVWLVVVLLCGAGAAATVLIGGAVFVSILTGIALIAALLLVTGSMVIALVPLVMTSDEVSKIKAKVKAGAATATSENTED